MERFTIEKTEVHNNDYFSVLIKDNQENISFWIDCGLIDGYGNKHNFSTEELYIDWDFNQYIFDLTNTNDIRAKEYQENITNIEALTDFIDNSNDILVKILTKKTEYKEVISVLLGG